MTFIGLGGVLNSLAHVAGIDYTIIDGGVGQLPRGELSFELGLPFGHGIIPGVYLVLLPDAVSDKLTPFLFLVTSVAPITRGASTQ